MGEYVQFGCGWVAPDDWRSFDSSPTLRFEHIPVIGKLYTKNSRRFPLNVEYGDIVRGLPVHEESCGAIYCSHVLEHLTLHDFRKSLKNVYVHLEPGGCFRLVVPDLEYSMKKYIDNPASDAALVFLRETQLGKEEKEIGFMDFLKDWLGNRHHLWMWDYKSLAKELENVGFIDIRRAEYGDAKDVKFNEVEKKERWDNCLGFECVKPWR